MTYVSVPLELLSAYWQWREVRERVLKAATAGEDFDLTKPEWDIGAAEDRLRKAMPEGREYYEQ